MPTTTLAETDGGGRIELGCGEAVELRLAANPTTGYRWETEGLDARVLADEGQRPEAPPSPAPGASGRSILRFRAVGAGSTILRLKYWQPWTKDVTERFSVTIRVLP